MTVCQQQFYFSENENAAWSLDLARIVNVPVDVFVVYPKTVLQKEMC
jgi:hypothetical protein